MNKKGTGKKDHKKTPPHAMAIISSKKKQNEGPLRGVKGIPEG